MSGNTRVGDWSGWDRIMLNLPYGEATCFFPTIDVPLLYKPERPPTDPDRFAPISPMETSCLSPLFPIPDAPISPDEPTAHFVSSDDHENPCATVSTAASLTLDFLRNLS